MMPDAKEIAFDPNGHIDVGVDGETVSSFAILNSERLIMLGEVIEAIVELAHRLDVGDRVFARYRPSEMQIEQPKCPPKR